MSPLELWLLAGAFGLIGGCYAWQWQHRNECEKKRLQAMKDITDLQADVKYLMNEVGEDHNEGLRQRMHQAENQLRRLEE